jgi:hypothetical protein
MLPASLQALIVYNFIPDNIHILKAKAEKQVTLTKSDENVYFQISIFNTFLVIKHTELKSGWCQYLEWLMQSQGKFLLHPTTAGKTEAW